MKQWTSAEVASELNVEKPQAYGLIQFLIAKGLAREDGSRREPGQKGKGQTIYVFSEDLVKRVGVCMSLLAKDFSDATLAEIAK